MRDDPYHVTIVKERLQNKMLPTIMPDLIDEVGLAVQRSIPEGGDGRSSCCLFPGNGLIIENTQNGFLWTYRRPP